MAFLPTGYQEPVKVSNYMKLVEGENNIRILSSAIVGYEYWVDEENDEGKQVRKPIRLRQGQPIPVEFADDVKFFWVFVVYNQDAKKIQILEVTQAKVRKPIKALVDNKKWGDPKEYDITITKTKTGPDPKDVDYQVTPNPKEEIDAEVVAKYEEMNLNLELLFDGEDPFKKTLGSGDKEAQEAFDRIPGKAEPAF